MIKMAEENEVVVWWHYKEEKFLCWVRIDGGLFNKVTGDLEDISRVFAYRALINEDEALELLRERFHNYVTLRR